MFKKVIGFVMIICLVVILPMTACIADDACKGGKCEADITKDTQETQTNKQAAVFPKVPPKQKTPTKDELMKQLEQAQITIYQLQGAIQLLNMQEEDARRTENYEKAQKKD